MKNLIVLFYRFVSILLIVCFLASSVFAKGLSADEVKDEEDYFEIYKQHDVAVSEVEMAISQRDYIKAEGRVAKELIN